MFAVIRTGGKQYHVKKDDIIDVELLEGEVGQSIEFKDILFVNDGKVAKVKDVKGFSVTAEIIGEAKGEKVESVKYIPGNHYKRFGHRQRYSRVKITSIESHEKGKGGKHGT